MALKLWNQSSHKRKHIHLGLILTAWLGLWIQQTSGADVITAAVGQTVNITAQFSGTINSYTWYRGTVALVDQIILTYIGASGLQRSGPQYTGRETGLSDGSLRIRDVLTNYTGNYTAMILTQDGISVTDTKQLRVYDKLDSPALVHTSGSGFSGHEFTLQCQAGNQTVERYVFQKDNMNITCNQQHINCSEPSAFLSFHPLKESDSGNYTCTIYNPVSRNASLPLEVNVKLPISNVNISRNVTSGYLWEDEDPVHLSCRALGTDPVFTWMRSGSALPQDSRYHLSTDNSSLTISPVTRGDTGPFQCTASNTANSERSINMTLPIAWRPNGSIECGANNISGDEIQFSCSWHGGNPLPSVDLILPTITPVTNLTTVLFNTLWSNITTNTTLICNGTQQTLTSMCSLALGLPYSPNFENNSSSNATEGSPYSLAVNLGSSMRASSVQVLPATFAWSRGSSSLPGSDSRVVIYSNAYFSQMTISEVTVSDSGDYHCLAGNLMGTTSFSFRINVQPRPETTTSPPTTKPESGTIDPAGSGGLSAGAIAGIVIGVVALVVLIGVTVYCVLKNKKGKKEGSNTRNEQGDPNAMQMNETPQKGDINYAALNFNNKQTIPPADYPGATETLYAQVKKN